ncbi:MAG: calcium-binding protein, partial [Okeania sp. SIO2H7]|nr:calcium-binding protein [Okeania sp. SIO2H7]
STSGEDIGDEFATVESNGDAASSEAIIVYNSSNGALFYNANGSDSGFGDGSQFATLTGTPNVSAENFVIR